MCKLVREYVPDVGSVCNHWDSDHIVELAEVSRGESFSSFGYSP